MYRPRCAGSVSRRRRLFVSRASRGHAGALRRLRAKLERDPSRPRHLKTVCGVGYQLHPDAAIARPARNFVRVWAGAILLLTVSVAAALLLAQLLLGRTRLRLVELPWTPEP
jgi:hypothetical protein